MMSTNFGTGKHNFGYVPDPDINECCADAAKDESICFRCRHYEEHHGIPTCCGIDFEEQEED